MSNPQTPGYRPEFVTQRDGSALANSNCRMASIAMGLDLETVGGKTSTGSKMRSYTDDQSGGTDSGDARQAWDRGYGASLIVRDGHTFDDALDDLREFRGVNLDVWHATVGGPCLSGSGAYGHNIYVHPDYNADGWAVGDPWCTNGYHRVSESKLRSGAERWGSEVYGRALDESDYPSGGPGPRDPRVLLIVARIAKRLMSEAYPGGPMGRLIKADTGGGAILYTATHPLTEVDEMPPLYSTGGVSRVIPSGTPVYDKPGGTKTGTIGSGSVVYRLIAKEASGSPSWYLIDGGGSGGLMRWVYAKDLDG